MQFWLLPFEIAVAHWINIAIGSSSTFTLDTGVLLLYTLRVTAAVHPHGTGYCNWIFRLKQIQ